eukprot:SAG22_NODE_14350_length_376_cov_46.054152_2_plen_40_part_01
MVPPGAVNTHTSTTNAVSGWTSGGANAESNALAGGGRRRK